MTKTVSLLHEKLYMIHCDLHQKNWLLDQDDNLVLCDFGCAKILGPFGKVPIGTKVFYADMHSPPEMQYGKG